MTTQAPSASRPPIPGDYARCRSECTERPVCLRAIADEWDRTHADARPGASFVVPALTGPECAMRMVRRDP